MGEVQQITGMHPEAEREQEESLAFRRLLHSLPTLHLPPGYHQQHKRQHQQHLRGNSAPSVTVGLWHAEGIASAALVTQGTHGAATAVSPTVGAPPVGSARRSWMASPFRNLKRLRLCSCPEALLMRCSRRSYHLLALIMVNQRGFDWTALLQAVAAQRHLPGSLCESAKMADELLKAAPVRSFCPSLMGSLSSKMCGDASWHT